MASLLLVLVIVILGTFQVLTTPVCSRWSQSQLKNLQVCNLTVYPSNTYFWDKENCINVDKELVTLIQTFSENYWKNQVDYPSACLEEFVRFSCSEACPICTLPDYITPPQSNSQLDQVYLAMGQGLATCNQRCESFLKACNQTPGLSAMVSFSNCSDLTVSVVSSQSAAPILQKPTRINCTNHNSTLISNNNDIGTPEALGYATCDAGFLMTIDAQICTATNSDQKIWNDRAGEMGESTCETKDSSLIEVLPHFVTTFNSYNICVEDYQECLDAYADFVCSSSCPFCENNQTRLPCKSQCEAIVSSCAGLPVLGITARMNCSRYSDTSCSSLSSQGVSEIIDMNASEESIICPQRNETNQTSISERTTEDWVTFVSNEEIIHSLLKFRSDRKQRSGARFTREVSESVSSCESISKYLTRTSQNSQSLGVCIVNPEQKLQSPSECLSMDSRLLQFLRTFSQVQSIDRSERASQLSCLDAYSTFLCSSACRPCESDGACYESCSEFKGECRDWPPSNSMTLSAPGIPSAFVSDFWTGAPFYSIQSQFDCTFFTSNVSACSFVPTSLGSLGWISDVNYRVSKNQVNLNWDLTLNKRASSEFDVRVTVELVSTTSSLDQWKKLKSLPSSIAQDLKTNKLKFKAPKGTHTLSITAFSSSSSSMSPISTQVVIEV